MTPQAVGFTLIGLGLMAFIWALTVVVKVTRQIGVGFGQTQDLLVQKVQSTLVGLAEQVKVQASVAQEIQDRMAGAFKDLTTALQEEVKAEIQTPWGVYSTLGLEGAVFLVYQGICPASQTEALAAGLKKVAEDRGYPDVQVVLLPPDGMLRTADEGQMALAGWCRREEAQRDLGNLLGYFWGREVTSETYQQMCNTLSSGKALSYRHSLRGGDGNPPTAVELLEILENGSATVEVMVDALGRKGEPMVEVSIVRTLESLQRGGRVTYEGPATGTWRKVV